MDKQHKEELRQNDLQEFLTHGGDFMGRYGNTILLVVLVGVVAFLGARWLGGMNERRMESAYTALADATNPEGKLSVAEEYESSLPAFAPKARLDAADLLVQEAVLNDTRFGTAPLTEAKKRENLERAAKLYQQVVTAGHTPLQKLYARRGLASALESLGNFKAAREQYEAIARDAAVNWPDMAATAQRRLGDLDRIARPVTLAAPPKVQMDLPGSGPAGAGRDIPGVSVPGVSPLLKQPEGPAPAPAPAPTTPAAPAPAAPAPAPAPAPTTPGK